MYYDTIKLSINYLLNAKTAKWNLTGNIDYSYNIEKEEKNVSF